MQPDTQPNESPNTSSGNRAGLWIGLIIAVLAVGGLAYWALTGDTADTMTETNTTSNNPSSQLQIGAKETDSDTPASTQTATIVFTNNGFEPNSITVKKGTVVTIKNESDNDVEFSSDNHPSHLTNREMNTDTLAAGTSTTYTANTVGTFGFHDHIDDSKTGTVVVTE